MNNLNLTIKKGERLGIISPSGEGKSTLLDIILGLIEPQSGSVIVGGQSIHGSNESKLRIAWWRNVAQVPQNIYLIDGSFVENIAFGVKKSEIDMERVFQAAKNSQIADRIEQNLLSYTASVGERGVRLSGGERQRIGIARALYRQIGLLVLDEATSALDTETESKLMDTVYSLEKNLTVVIVAHRLTTLKRCDRVVKLEKGIITNEYVGKAIDDLILQSLGNNMQNVLDGKCHE